MSEVYCHTDGAYILRAEWLRDLAPGDVITKDDILKVWSVRGLPWESDEVSLSVKDMIGMRIDSLAGLKTGVKKGEPITLSDADFSDICAAMTVPVDIQSSGMFYCSTGYFPEPKKEEEQLHTVGNPEEAEECGE